MTNPLTPITLEDERRQRYAFRPQSDMTPIESALCAQLFVKMVMSAWHGPVDWRSYVEEHRLARHFAGPLNLSEKTMPTASQGDAGDEPPIKLIDVVATRDLESGIPKGYRIKILEGMPIPDGYERTEA